jgi:hypothetical protein
MVLGWVPFKIVSDSPRPSDFRGEDLNVIFNQNMPNLHNRYKSAERKISQKNLESMFELILTYTKTAMDN